MTKLILIRHAETRYNAERRYNGQSQISLSENGRNQVKALKKYIDPGKIDVTYSSDLARCAETAEIIEFKNIIFLKELREINFGIAEGLTRNEFLSKHPDVCKTWDDNWLNYVLPEGESFELLNKRVIPAVEKIVNENKEKTIAIVTHSGVIRLILAHYLIDDINGFWKFSVDNASMSGLFFENDYTYLKKLNITGYDEETAYF